MEGYDFNHIPGFPIPLPSAPNPDEGQLSRLNGEKRWGWEEGKEKTLHIGSSLAACWEWGWEDRCHSSGRLGVFESIGCMDCFLGRSQ